MSSSENLINSYRGSQIFKSLSDSIGIQVDYINFIVTQLTAFLVAFLFRRYWTVENVNYNLRLIGTLVPGVLITTFCYGSDIIHLICLTVLSYLATIYSPSKHVHKVVLVLVLLFLSRLHLIRMILDYGGYAADITGPIMIAVQKVTSLAFSVHDGMGRDDKDLTDEQRKYAIKRRPTILEYFSYVFSFQTVIAGPLIFYHDYIEFIDGSNFSRHLMPKNKLPSPKLVVLEKFSTAAMFALGLVFVAPIFPPDLMASDDFIREHSVFFRTAYTSICVSLVGFKYYLVWKLGEAICNQSGLGFNGFDSDGRENWDLASNVDIIKVETSLNLRGMFSSWNKTTQTWLRRCAYERTSSYRTLSTYVLSAVWHGFYPGYYMTFLTAALITMAARTGRRCLRHHFQSSMVLSKFYDLSTLIVNRVATTYMLSPFILLSFDKSFKLYQSLYFFVHILCLIVIFVMPKIFKPLPKTTKVN